MISLSVCLPDWQQCQFISDCSDCPMSVLLPGNALAATGGGDLQDHCLRLLLPNVVALSNVSILCECSLYSLTFIFSFLFIDLRLCSPFFFLFSLFSFFFSRLHVNELALSRLRRQSLCDLRVIWRNWQLTTQLLSLRSYLYSCCWCCCCKRWKILFTNHPFSLLICDVCAVLWEHSR